MYDRWVGPDEVLAKTGVPPEKIVEYMALLGDSVDNVAGIPGVGPKTASQLIQQFGTAEAMLSHLDQVPKEKLRENLRAHAESIRLARRLVEIDLDHPDPGDGGRAGAASPRSRRAAAAVRGARVHPPGARDARCPARTAWRPGSAEPGTSAEKTIDALRFSTPEVLSSEEVALPALEWLAQGNGSGCTPS